MNRSPGWQILLKTTFVFIANSGAVAPADLRSVEILIEDDWTPYAFYRKAPGKGRRIQGISVDLISEALKVSGYKAIFRPMPYARCLKLASQEKHIVCFNAIKDKNLEKDHFFPREALIRGEHKIFSLKTNPAHNYTLKDLYNRRVGLVNGYTYGDDFENAVKIHKDYAPTETANLLKLARGRVEFIIMEEISANYQINRNRELKDKLKIVGAIGFFEIRGAFSKLNPRSPEVMEALDVGLRTIKENGRHKHILNKWTTH